VAPPDAVLPLSQLVIRPRQCRSRPVLAPTPGRSSRFGPLCSEFWRGPPRPAAEGHGDHRAAARRHWHKPAQGRW